MTHARIQSDPPTAVEMIEAVLVLMSGAVVGAPMLPGFVLCVPFLAPLGVVVLVTLLALGAIGMLVVAILAMPYLLVRSLRRTRAQRRRAAPEHARGVAPDRLPRRGPLDTASEGASTS